MSRLDRTSANAAGDVLSNFIAKFLKKIKKQPVYNIKNKRYVAD